MRRLILAIGAPAFAGFAVVLWVGGALTAPNLKHVGPPPRDMPVESVSFLGSDGNRLAGWLLSGGRGRGVIVLLHGIRADRRSMLGRARFLYRAGYSVLSIDFQGHGESPGTEITFGYRESKDAVAAVRYVRKRFPGERIGVIGVSLGGAASLVGDAVLPVDAMILEAVYSTLERAVENRIAIILGDFGRFLAPLLLWQVKPRLGFDPGNLSPLDRISRIKSPVLIIAGGCDARTTLAESRALFRNAPDPKTLWVIEEAKHQDFHRFVPERYERRVLAFLDRHMQSGAGH